MRDEILKLLNGKKISSTPGFSGLIHVTAEGLASEGLSLHEIHHDAGKMARAAASTFKLTGMPSAALPLDLCSPAEALGAELIFYNDDEMQFPQVKKLLFQSTKEIGGLESREIESSGRIGLICEAIGLAKRDIGDRAVISGIIPGPYTLMIYICKVQNLVHEMRSEPQMVLDALFHLSTFLSTIGNAYREAGADFITIHEMGGSPGFIGPKPFEQFVLPALQHLTKQLPHPTVLSVCGKTDSAMSLLTQSGADAISMDQMTNLSAARTVLKDLLLFGNVDPVAALWRGDESSVTEAVKSAKEAGVDAVWPGCDLVIQTPFQNIKAFCA
ncbi:MAG TPA: uroporphyrinogen decarboxylase family protein [Anaerolineales bacterium]|nr:uroporphyrinogen decarboxylase family protein [Anaerolineales bacterium]